MIPMSESEYRMLGNTPSEGDLFSATKNGQAFRPSVVQKLKNFVTTRRRLSIAIAVTTLVLVVAVIGIAVGVSSRGGGDSNSGNPGKNGSKSVALFSACGSPSSVNEPKTPIVKTSYQISKEFVGM